jgi:hypothetical protein
MAKIIEAETGKFVVDGGDAAIKFVRNAKTGRLVAVKGVGALKDSELRIRKGLSLTKPIAAQALSERRNKRKAG